MTSPARNQRLLARLGAASTGDASTALCGVSADVTATSGAGIMLMAGGVARGAFCSSDVVSARVEELQFTLGEGPCVEAYERDCIILEPDLAHPLEHRWAAFTPAALQAGVRAMFGFPMKVHGLRLGTLNLYRDRPGGLSLDEHANAVGMAAIAASQVLTAEVGVSGAGPVDARPPGLDLRLVVHQAAGMVSVQIVASVDEALVRLRAHAYAHDRPLTDVAVDVVERRLRFSDEDR